MWHPDGFFVFLFPRLHRKLNHNELETVPDLGPRASNITTLVLWVTIVYTCRALAPVQSSARRQTNKPPSLPPSSPSLENGSFFLARPVPRRAGRRHGTRPQRSHGQRRTLSAGMEMFCLEAAGVFLTWRQWRDAIEKENQSVMNDKSPIWYYKPLPLCWITLRLYLLVFPLSDIISRLIPWLKSTPR